MNFDLCRRLQSSNRDRETHRLQLCPWLLRTAQLSVQEILKPRALNGKYAREDISLCAILFTAIPKVFVWRGGSYVSW